MKSNFKGWNEVVKILRNLNLDKKSDSWLNKGQHKSILSLAKHLPNNGMLIADEVGMGKTRIAVALAKAVSEAGGRVAILIPSGLGYQWQEELRAGQLNDVPDVIRSLDSYFNDWPEKGWYSKRILLVSHLFSNWRHHQSSSSWRLALLPEIYARVRKEQHNIPRNYYTWSDEYCREDIKIKAQQIVETIPFAKKNPARIKLEEIRKNLSWSEDLYLGNGYTQKGSDTIRNSLKSCIGLGLGVFDLIIIDEAHKNRGDNTGLSKLLTHIICKSANSRVVGLTATPVELDLEDWLGTLNRIGVDLEDNTIRETIQEYAESVKRVRESWKINSIDREKFRLASKSFKNSLKNYLIRRDKREDPSVDLFKEKSNLPYSKYRKEKEVLIDPKNSGFPESWRKAICAAEALSFVSKMREDPWAKKVRLTLASGHSISSWLDTQTADVDLDNEDISEIFPDFKIDDISKPKSQKKNERIEFWKKRIANAVPRKEGNLFNHPAILAAITCIEDEYTKHNKKVLVFGKFTRPMKSLVLLLNAREMINRLDSGKFWPQYTLRKEEEKAVVVAMIQLRDSLKKEWNINEVKRVLEKNSSKMESLIKKFRRSFFHTLYEGFSRNGINGNNISYNILDRLQEISDSKKGREIFNHLTIACFELVYGLEIDKTEEICPIDLCNKYLELVSAITDLDKESEEYIEEAETDKLFSLLEKLNDRLKEEYGSQFGKFARLMFGETKQHTRRLMQLAFNREGSFPFVLVAQSRVGREGLNLHKACKTVMMLHPEWNPAVAEQQIGRVDRLGSLWSNLINKYNGSPQDIPTIEIRPVIFKSTYDEQNWRVLRERWDDLRAQLHGIIIPDRISEGCDLEDKKIIDELNSQAPNFAP